MLLTLIKKLKRKINQYFFKIIYHNIFLFNININHIIYFEKHQRITISFQHNKMYAHITESNFMHKKIKSKREILVLLRDDKDPQNKHIYEIYFKISRTYGEVAFYSFDWNPQGAFCQKFNITNKNCIYRVKKEKIIETIINVTEKSIKKAAEQSLISDYVAQQLEVEKKAKENIKKNSLFC